ncbi:MAG: hypothetical protein AAF985_21600 [Bacteroidota bacterium]
MKSSNVQLSNRFIWVFFLSWSSLLANNPLVPTHLEEQSIFDVMAFQEVLEVELELDLKEIIQNRRSREAFKGQFSFVDQNGQRQIWKAKVTQRGRFRRGKCIAMPPLKLNFKKKELAAAGLAKFDDLKLVTHCVEDDKAAKELLLREYLAYKLYNELTDQSFRVQLIKIKYRDINTGEELKQWGFLIEDTAQLRSRLDLTKPGNTIGVQAEQFEAFAFKRMALFQYMIGNTDWNIATNQNLKILEKGEQYLAIPYDFDFSALVSAPYATLNSSYNQTSLKDRVYLGAPEDLDDLSDNLEAYRNKKDQLLDLVKDFDLLPRKARREVLTYLKSFYKNMDQINLPILAAEASEEDNQKGE